MINNDSTYTSSSPETMTGSEETTSRQVQERQRYAQAQASMSAPTSKSVVDDPVGFEQSVVRKAMEAAQTQHAVDNLVAQKKAERPELVPFFQEIRSNAAQAFDAAMKRGEYLTTEQAIDEGIKQFENKLQQYQQAAQAKQQGEFMRRNALQFTPGSQGQPNAQKITAAAIKAMSDEEFLAYDKYRQNSRGR